MKEFATVLLLVAAITTVSVVVVVHGIQRLYHSERIARWARRFVNPLQGLLGVTWLVLAGLNWSDDSGRFLLSPFLEAALGIVFLAQWWLGRSSETRAAP